MGQGIHLTMDEGEIAVLEMNDPEGGNILGRELTGELLDALEEARLLGPKVLIIRGRPDVFCAGGSREFLRDIFQGHVKDDDIPLPERLLELPFPLVAAMEGHAVGGGLVFALCSDLVVAALESRYGANFTSLGFTPGMGCTTLLAELVGPYLATEMMFTGRFYRGSELAQRATNINRIVPRDQVASTARELAESVADKPREVLRMLKNTLAVRKKTLLAQARVQESLMHRVCVADPGTLERIEQTYIR